METLTTGRFAQLCNTTKETLYHYREIGLLVPFHSSSNGYYYYTLDQFFVFRAIRALQDCGCSLPDIKNYLNNYGPRELLNILVDKHADLVCKMKELKHADDYISSFIRITREALDSPCGIPTLLQYREQHFIATVLPQEYSENPKMITQYINAHCSHCIELGISQFYPLGYQISFQSMMQGQFRNTHILSPISENIDDNHCITFPEGNYAVIYHEGNYLSLQEDIQKLLTYIRKWDLKITGGGYTMDLIGDPAVLRADNFIIKLCIPVKQADTMAET